MLTFYIFATLIGFLLLNVPVAAAIGLTSVLFFAGLGQGEGLLGQP